MFANEDQTLYGNAIPLADGTPPGLGFPSRHYVRERDALIQRNFAQGVKDAAKYKWEYSQVNDRMKRRWQTPTISLIVPRGGNNPTATEVGTGMAPNDTYHFAMTGTLGGDMGMVTGMGMMMAVWNLATS